MTARRRLAQGNDAGDLDSLVSAVALAYWLDSPRRRFVPAAAFPRARASVDPPSPSSAPATRSSWSAARAGV